MKIIKSKFFKIILCLLVVIAVVVGITFIPKYSYIRTRVTFKISDTIRDIGLKAPDDVVRHTDLAYGTDPMQVLDIYYPEGTDHPLPTIVSFHGGGYTYGDKDLYQYYCMNLAQHGFTVVNFSYRLAPEFKFPSQINDATAAVTYAIDHANEYFIDPNQIFTVGDSAGAHLNAMFSIAKTNPEYASLLGLDMPEFTLRAIALNCGSYTIENRSEKTPYFMDGDPAQYTEQMDLMGHITDDFPPAFIMTATGDMALPNAAPFAEFLDSKGLVNELHIYGDQKNKLPHVFHLNMKSEDAKICNDEECAFLSSYIDN